MVQSLSFSFLHRSLSSFTRFLGQNVWALEEVAETALEQFFHRLRIKAHSVLFVIVDDTIIQKSGKKIPGCAWHRDHAQKAYVFGHQWVLFALLYKEFLLPLWAKLYHPKGTKGCGPFQTKITMAKRMLQTFRLPIPCKVYLLADSWYWAKELAQLCQKYGYHMISQLKTTSVVFMNGKKTKVTTLSDISSAYREVSVFIYGKNKTLKIARFVHHPRSGKSSCSGRERKTKEDLLSCFYESAFLFLVLGDIRAECASQIPWPMKALGTIGNMVFRLPGYKLITNASPLSL